MAGLVEEEDERSSSESESEEDGVQLGFCEAREGLLLFESEKWEDWDGGVAGGVEPVLLDRRRAPEAVRCESCGAVMSFLIQVYAPLDEPEDAFHRAVYVFACGRCGEGAAALRSQLPRDNAVYSKNCPVPPQPKVPAGPVVSATRYEVVVEEEPKSRDRAARAPAAEGHSSENSETCASADNAEDAAFTQADVAKATGVSAPDASTLRFLARVDREPAQVLRYNRGGRPLWVSGKRRIKKPPPCPACRGPRIFEFQVLPQLLHALRVDAPGSTAPQRLNFGAIHVFTCAASCSGGSDDTSPVSYHPEFALLQPPLDDHPRLGGPSGSSS